MSGIAATAAIMIKTRKTTPRMLSNVLFTCSHIRFCRQRLSISGSKLREESPSQTQRQVQGAGLHCEDDLAQVDVSAKRGNDSQRDAEKVLHNFEDAFSKPSRIFFKFSLIETKS